MAAIILLLLVTMLALLMLRFEEEAALPGWLCGVSLPRVSYSIAP